MTLKGILFDLDDTLIDWGHFAEEWERIETPHIEKVYRYMSTLAALEGDFQAYKTAFFSRTKKAWGNARTTLQAPHLGRVLVEAAIAVGMPEDRADIDALLDAYEWGVIEGTSAFPEAISVLEKLRAHNIKMGIVTNAFQPMRLRDIELHGHGLREFFPDCRISAADVGVLKPHPDIFKRALACMGTPPEETVFIGDNPTADIAGAQAAGMLAVLRVIARPRPLISGLIVPDAAINSLMELPVILSEWFPGWDQVTQPVKGFARGDSGA
ncbi:MAG: HAD family hydrolase [Chloroflexota bacterium]